MVADVRGSGFNTIIAQVRVYGDAYYNSNIVSKAADIPADFDPLRTLLAEAKAGDKPLKVYAMLVTYRVWSRNLGGQPPADHIYSKNPGWLCESVDGGKEFGDTGVESWLDPGVAEVQDHLALVAVDLVKNYEVDGVLLDRLRYPDNTLKSGYNPAAVERYNREKGKSGKPEPQDADWIAWRRDQVTATLRKMREAVKGAKPSVAVAINSITFGAGPQNIDDYRRSDAFARTLQDWVAWGQEGLIDINVLMNYKQAERFAGDYDRWARFALEQAGKARVVVAVGAWLNEPRYTAAMMLQPILDPRAGGVAVSSFHSPAKSGFDSALAFDAFRKVMDPVYVGSRSKEIAAVLEAGASDALARLGALAAALGMGTAAPDVPAPPIPSLSSASLPPLVPPQSSELGLPMLPALSTPGPSSAPSALPPLSMPSLAPAIEAPPPASSIPRTQQPAMDQSEISMPPYAAAAAPTPAFMPPRGATPPPDLASRSSVNIPMMAGESNWQGGAVPSSGYRPRLFEAPKIDPNADLARSEPTPMAPLVTTKPDFSDPNSIYVPKSQPAGMKNYAGGGGRTPISAPSARVSAPLEVIVLSNGKQFIGRVVDRAEQITIQLENGGTIKIPAGRVAETRSAATMTEAAPQ